LSRKSNPPRKVVPTDVPAAPPSGALWQSRAVFLLLAAALAFAPILLYARGRWLAVVTVTLTDGLCVALWVCSAWLLGRLLLRPLRLKTGPVLSFVTSVGLGLGVMSLAALPLALAGLLNRWTTLLLLAIGPLAALRTVIPWLRSKPNVPVEAWFARPLTGQFLLLLAAPLLGVMLTGASIVPGLLWKPDDPHPYDALEYHLQIPREWYELGRMTQLKHNVFSYFPNGVEIHYLMAMHVRGGPWAAMYQCQFFSLAWVLLGAATVYGVIRETLDQSPTTAAAGAVLFMATPWIVMLGSVAYTESALALYTALTAAWILHALTKRDESQPLPLKPMLLAGIMAGLACGVKYTAVPMVVIAFVAAAAILSLFARDLRRTWQPLAAFAVVAAAVMSPWLIRNFAWTRNPVFPLAMSTLGRAHFDPIQVERFRIAHSPPPDQNSLPARVTRAARVIAADWQYGYVLWPLTLGALFIAWRRREARLLAAYLLIVLFVWIAFTHLLGRFYVLTIPVAAMSVGLVRWKPWPMTAAAVALLATCVGLRLIDTPFDARCTTARVGLFGLEDLSWMVPPELTEMDRSDTQVSLMGDAEGFLYRIPSTRLHYRTVFDLPGSATDIYQAWLGVPKDKVKGLVVINPPEIERLSKTYYHVPNLPYDFSGPRDHPFVIKK
jgi:hypothetical protein